MKKVDFLFLYELKTRELEYLALLKCELARRGYTTALEAANSLWGENIFFDAEVIVTASFCMSYAFFGNGVLFKKALELTTEQIFNLEWQNKECIADEIQKSVIVNAWGQNYKEYLINHRGINSNNIVLLGHPVLDFCKDRFNDYYNSREAIASEYNLDKEKKWNVFISSFVLNHKNEDWVKQYDLLHGTTDSYRSYINEIQTIGELAEWFRRLLYEKRDQIIIYRPHPAEKVNKVMKDLEKSISNFYIIRDYGVRQWIKICDRLFTWISTSSIEAFYMNKPVYLLRPYFLDKDIDMPIFSHPEKAICDYNGFYEVVNNEGIVDKYNPFDQELYNYYYFSPDEYTYERMANLCEEMYKNDCYTIPEDIRGKMRGNIRKTWESMSAKERFRYRMRRSHFYSLYHRIFSSDVEYMNLRKGELALIENRINKCICNC